MSCGKSDNEQIVAAAWAETIFAVVIDSDGVERPVEPASRLSKEIEAATHEISRHFVRQLPQHCNMLAIAIADALQALNRLEPSLAFSGVLVARGLLEAAADLYWLSDPSIDGVER